MNDCAVSSAVFETSLPGKGVRARVSARRLCSRRRYLGAAGERFKRGPFYCGDALCAVELLCESIGQSGRGVKDVSCRDEGRRWQQSKLFGSIKL